ncbi:lytic polysaccharide monooxygenase auxiliary activity family 9 protein [Myceligenerans indicum]|uniref:Cellulose-binding protein n=1 Tax=Myceligenerans indicum TaxID=2593663 RepID=A0ABS1LNM3_9MICO|nr:lytic polysaccharide monooxygenase [Myceligenerans indicum]MBL0887388.1 cellulose-binding protein [Myceligenerans indicum]
MTVRARTRGLILAAAMALAAPMGLVAAVSADTAMAPPAAAHGSVTDPPSRNYGCLERWGDDHLNPEMATVDPMCWQAWQANPNAMWNWNGLYVNGLGENYEQAIPDGQLCSGGHAESGRYDSLDVPGEWVATGVDPQFHLTLTDGAEHGADYLRIYVSRPGFDPTTEALGWDDVELVQETGYYPSQGTYETDVDLGDRSGRAVLFTVWLAGHMDQKYFLCSDINIGGGDLWPEEPGPDPDPTEPEPEPTDPGPEPSDPGDGTAGCTATVTVTNSWSGGYQADVTVTAGDSAISGWQVAVDGATITQAWNATVSGDTLTNADWNGALAAGGSTTAGFIGSGSADGLAAACSAG